MKILSKSKRWAIMDVKRKVIARGVEHKRLYMRDDSTKARIKLYNSKKSAQGALKKYSFSYWNDVADYFVSEYGCDISYGWISPKELAKYLRAVEVVETIEIA